MSLRSIFVVLSFLAGTGPALAQTPDILLGGVHWKIPPGYVVGKMANSLPVHNLTLSFELPSFKPVGAADFKDAYPDDAKPILTVNLSDDPHFVSGQPLLDQLIATAGPKTITSSLGGLEYQYRPAGNAADAEPFNLYVNPSASGPWFFACYFKPNFAPLPCEMRAPFSKGIYITYKFPDEYISQILPVEARARIILKSFEPPYPQIPFPNIASIPLSTPCWVPQPNTYAAEVVPLKLGPEVWHLPRAYAEQFLPWQPQIQEATAFQLALKLPDLEPINPSELSLSSEAGFGSNHLVLAISYDDRPGSGPEVKDNIASYVDATNYLGQNPFLNDKEYQYLGGSSETLKYLYNGTYQLLFVSNDPSANSSSFPPDFFMCDQFGGTPGCTFRVAGHFDQPALGHYFIEYFLSRDYFSQFTSINYCVGQLYHRFRYGPDTQGGQ